MTAGAFSSKSSTTCACTAIGWTFFARRPAAGISPPGRWPGTGRCFTCFTCTRGRRGRSRPRWRQAFPPTKKLNALLGRILRCPHVAGFEKLRAVLFTASPALCYRLAAVRGALAAEKEARHDPAKGLCPLVSVIVPVYGVEAYLPACLASLLPKLSRILN